MQLLQLCRIWILIHDQMLWNLIRQNNANPDPKQYFQHQVKNDSFYKDCRTSLKQTRSGMDKCSWIRRGTVDGL
jgi:hypothetical protein